MRKFILCAVILLLFAGPVTAQDDERIFPRDLEDLRVGDETQLTATVVNPLPIEDEIEIAMTGDAIVKGLLTVEIDDSDPDVYGCNPAQTICSVSVGADAEKDVTLNVEATSIGQGNLKGVVNSTTTGLSSEEQIAVRVDTGYVGVNVSAPGITTIHLFLIGIIAGLAAFFATRRSVRNQS